MEAEQDATRRPAPILFRRRDQKTDPAQSGRLQASAEETPTSCALKHGSKSSSSRAAYNRLVGLEIAAEACLPLTDFSEHEKDLQIALMILAENSLVGWDLVG